MCLKYRNSVENTLPEEELQRKTRLKNFTIMQYSFSNIKVEMLASHRLQRCWWRERGWQSRTSTALPLPSQYSESCMDRHAFATPCILSTILSLGLFLGGGPLQCILKHFGNWMRGSETNLSDLVLWIYSMLSRYKIIWFIIKACSTLQLSQVKKKS